MLETNRCKLMKIQQSDYEEVKELYLNHEVRRYLGGTVEEKQCTMKFQDMFKLSIDEYYWIIRKKEGMEFVGLISLNAHQDGIGTEVSYQLIPKWWGNGYGKEAVKRILDFAFGDLKLAVVVAETQSANIQSCKLLESVGMKLENQVIRFGAKQNIYRYQEQQTEYNKLRNELTQFMQISINKTAPHYDVIDQIEFDEYTEYLIKYMGTENSIISAYLLTPKFKKNGNGILIHHQHNGERHYGKSEVVGKVGDENQHLGLVLVREGFTILAPDSICFEDRRINATGTNPDENDFIQHYCEMNKRILKGESLMKKVIEESSIALSILINLQNINPNKVGILGHSYGGTTALFHGALDERIKYICTSGALASFSRRIDQVTGIEMASIIPGFIQKYEMIDVLKATYPRDVLILSATEDQYSIDADELYNNLINEIGIETEKTVHHLRFEGPHPLTSERVDKIVEWFQMK